MYVEFAKYSFHDRALIFYCCQEMPKGQIQRSAPWRCAAVRL
ncbi:hypothetical protein PGR6_18590 [Pseudomonas sp. GR 6-02]|nr:hypothetical protein PGR6_18590 [Pseudomonas sp. GR 6-02]